MASYLFSLLQSLTMFLYWTGRPSRWALAHILVVNEFLTECGPIPNVMAALPNIGGALCSMPQSLADAQYWSAVQKCCQDAKPVEISWDAPNYRIDLSRY